MSDVAVPVRPKPYRVEREPGGRVPEIGPLFNAALGDFVDNLGPYATAGVGPFLVTMVATMIMIPVVYIVMFGVMFGGMLFSALLAVGASEATGSEDVGALVAMLGYAATLMLSMGAILAVVGAVSAIAAPMQASLHRAVAAHQRGEGKLEFNSAFTTASEGLVPAMLVAFAYMLAVLLGSMACYVPALAVMVLAGFAPSLVYLHRHGVLSAFKQSSQHATAHPAFYLPFTAVFFGLSLCAAYIPILGPMFLVAFHVRACREIWGDPAPA